MKLICNVLMLAFFAGCSTTSSYIPYQTKNLREKECKLDVFMPGQTPKVETEIIGNYSVKEMGMSVGCDWEDTLSKNKEHACEKGAEGIQFISINAPSIRSTCYESQANFFVYKQ